MTMLREAPHDDAPDEATAWAAERLAELEKELGSLARDPVDDEKIRQRLMDRVRELGLTDGYVKRRIKRVEE